MPNYNYVAIDPEGNQSQGVVEANAPQAAQQLLRERGLVVTELSAAAEHAGRRKFVTGKVKLRELTVFSRQFAAMINAGMNLMKCLDILRGQVRDPRLAKIIGHLQADVQAGQTLSQTMAKHPGAFSKLYVSMIRAAETGRGNP